MKSEDNVHVRRAEALKQTLDTRLSKHADARLAQFGKWFAKHYPRHHLKLEMFVMGMDVIELNGGTFDPGRRSDEPGLLHVKGLYSHRREVWGELVDRMREALRDVEKITDDGQFGMPDVLEVGVPRISRFKRKKGV